MKLYVIENEHLWFGMLLSLGDGIEIKAPEHIRNRVLESAKNNCPVSKTMTYCCRSFSVTINP